MDGHPELRSTPAASVPDVWLRLLGGFELRLAGRPVPIPANEQRLLAVLALRGRCARTVLAGTLWPEVPDQRAQGSLRTAVWRLRRVEPWLVHTSVVDMDLAAGVTVDMHTLVRAAQRIVGGRQSGDTAGRELLQTPSDLSGELLPGWYDDWVIFERDRLRQLRLHALEALAAELLKHRRYGQALDLATESIRLEPLRESARRLVIAVHLAEHNVAEGLRHYCAFRDLLRAELGIEPSEDLMAMFPAAVTASLRAQRASHHR